MASWQNTDRDDSKPSWLTEEQKRYCIRTERGWEIPLDGAYGPTSNFATPTEIIVAMSIPTTDITRDSDNVLSTGGLTAYDVTGDGPYLSHPLVRDNFSLSFQATAAGATHYIPIVFSHSDTSRMFNMTLTNFGQIAAAANGFTGYSFSPTASAWHTQPTVRADSVRSVGPTGAPSNLTTNLGFIRVDRNVAGATSTANIAGGTAIRLQVVDGDGFTYPRTSAAGLTFTVSW